MPRLSLLALALSALVAGTANAQGPTSAPAEALSCGEVPDVQAQCLLDCPDTLVDFDCSSFGVDCFCKNDKGVIENTNIDAPAACGSTTLEEACKTECKSLSFVDEQKCVKDKPVCTCAPDDGLEGLGADASQTDVDYAAQMDEQASQIAAEIEANGGNPLPPALLENGTVVPAVADALAPAPTSSAASIGGAALAVAAAMLLA